MDNPIRISQFDLINQLRLPLIVLVTYAHSYGHVADDYSLLTSDWNTYEFLKLLISQTLVKVAMPVFFIISGFLFFVNVKEWNFHVYLTKIRRRLKTLLIPYVLWNLLMAVKLKTFCWSMFWTYWKPAGIQIDWFGNEQLMTAPANMPLWFLRDLMVVSLLTPIIYIAIRRFGCWLMAILTIAYLSGVYAFLPGLSAYAVFFFTFGAFLSIRKLDLLLTLQRFEWLAYIQSFFFGLAMLFSYHTSLFSSFMLCFRLTGAVAVFCLAARLLTHTKSRQSQILCDSSYFIYLAHFVFFLSFIDTAFFTVFGLSNVSLSFHYLLCPLLKILIFVSLYVAWKLLSAKIFPNLPVQKSQDSSSKV